MSGGCIACSRRRNRGTREGNQTENGTKTSDHLALIALCFAEFPQQLFIQWPVTLLHPTRGKVPGFPSGLGWSLTAIDGGSVRSPTCQPVNSHFPGHYQHRDGFPAGLDSSIYHAHHSDPPGRMLEDTTTVVADLTPEEFVQPEYELRCKISPPSIQCHREYC